MSKEPIIKLCTFYKKSMNYNKKYLCDLQVDKFGEIAYNLIKVKKKTLKEKSNFNCGSKERDVIG